MRRHALILVCIAGGVLLSTCKAERAFTFLRGRDSVNRDGRTYQKLDVSELGPCVTLDDGTDDNGALANVRGFLTNELPHQSIVTARDNLNVCTDAAIVDMAIVGHGGEGAVFVGGGGKRQAGKFLGSQNDAEWKPKLDDLVAGSGTLSLLACNTGVGSRGAKLLNLLATTTKRPVRAMNGIAYFDTNAILLEEGIDWNLAKPDAPATAVARPTPPNAPFETPAYVVLGNARFASESINRFHSSGWTAREKISSPATPLVRRTFFRLIDLEHPFTPPGLPLLPETGRIEVETTGGIRRTLIIYGDVLARDAIDETQFFDIDPTIVGGISDWAMFR
jgi:hypothetical protein